MQNNFSEYLYFNGEESNPFVDYETRGKRMDVFWHYEKAHYNLRKMDPGSENVKFFIMRTLMNSLDENKPSLPHFQMYLKNSPKNIYSDDFPYS